MYKHLVKRVIDLFLSVTAFLVLLPLFIIVVVILFLANSGSVFFRQIRPGKDEKPFSVIKFKTMNNRKDKNGQLLPDADRLTSIGRFIRKTSLDKIPQLLNVIKGDMSLVGPRPLLVEYLPLYNEQQKRRHEVRPGITSWAQVNGRNAISWQKKFELDVWYVDNMSFWLDMKILFLTVKKVFVSEGVSQEGRATVDYFKGNE